MRVVFLTGAGCSADSGLPTFRDAGGLWEGHRPEDVATPRAWRRDPALVWRFYQERRRGALAAEPNAAHRALAAFERRLTGAGHEVVLVTQNVDGLHERAGSRPLAMHGSLLELECEACGARGRDTEHLDPLAFVPCPCGHPRLRPAVVWFGEVPRHMDAIAAAVERCTHFVAIGTSGAVWPAAGFLDLARSAGAETIVQALAPPDNLAPTDRFVPGRAAAALPALLDELARAATP